MQLLRDGPLKTAITRAFLALAAVWVAALVAAWIVGPAAARRGADVGAPTIARPEAPAARPAPPSVAGRWPADEPMTAEDAGSVARKWWNQWWWNRWPHSDETGAAWMQDGLCLVGIGRPVPNPAGGGRRYARVDCLGNGPTFELALYDAIRNGYPPRDCDGMPIRWRANLFCLRIGKPPCYPEGE